MNLIFAKNFSIFSFNDLTKKENPVVVFSPDFLPELNLSDELSGKSNYIKTLCLKINFGRVLNSLLHRQVRLLLKLCKILQKPRLKVFHLLLVVNLQFLRRHQKVQK